MTRHEVVNLEKKTVWSGKITWLTKVLAAQDEDMSLDALPLIEYKDVVVCNCKPSAGKAETGRRSSDFAIQPV